MPTSHAAMRLFIVLTIGLLATVALADRAVDLSRQIAQEKQRIETKVSASDEYRAISVKLADLLRQLDENSATREVRQQLATERLALRQRQIAMLQDAWRASPVLRANEVKLRALKDASARKARAARRPTKVDKASSAAPATAPVPKAKDMPWVVRPFQPLTLRPQKQTPSELPALRIAMSGGVWLSRTDGTSDVVRGLSVVVVPRTIKSSVVVATLKEEQATLATIAEEDFKQADRVAAFRQARAEAAFATYMNGATTVSGSDGGLDQVDTSGTATTDGEYEQLLAAAKQTGYESPDVQNLIVHAQTSMRRIEQIAGMIPQVPDILDLSEVIELLHTVSPNGTPNIESILTATAVGKAITGIDGKYDVVIAVPPEQYLLCALKRLGTQSVVWCIPIDAKESISMKIDLSNDNPLDFR